jgi:hypothetical protein
LAAKAVTTITRLLAYHHSFRDIERKWAKAGQNHPQLAGQLLSHLDGGTCAGVCQGKLDAVQERSIEHVSFLEMAVGGLVSPTPISHHRVVTLREVAPKIRSISLLESNME